MPLSTFLLQTLPYIRRDPMQSNTLVFLASSESPFFPDSGLEKTPISSAGPKLNGQPALTDKEALRDGNESRMRLNVHRITKSEDK